MTLHRISVALLLGCVVSAPAPGEVLDERAPLRFQVYAGSEPALFPNSILIMGDRQAVLIDGQWWLSEGTRLADVIAETGLELTTVLVTHAHPDHYSGLNPVLERFPRARVLARKAVRDVIEYEYPAKLMHWQELVPGEMPLHPVVPEAFDGDAIELEGHEIRFVDLPPAETMEATAFYVPSARALIAGDLVFAGTHGYLADVNNPRLWIEALEFVRGVGPIDVVIPGHGPVGGAELIDQEVEYMRAYMEVARPGVRVRDVAREMMRRYPDHRGALLLWLTRGPGFGLSGAAEFGVPPELFTPPARD